jgi:putative transposase
LAIVKAGPAGSRLRRQLEDENAELKRMVAGLSLDRKMLRDVIRRKL